MRIAVVALAAALAACSYEVTTPDAVVNARPSPQLVLGADMSSFAVTQSDRDLPSSREEFYRAVLDESGGAVRSGGGLPLSLSATLRFLNEDSDGSFFLGFFSFFLPPLAFVPETPEKPFSVSYALRDRQNQVVYQRTLEGKIEGTFKGWYIARIDANKSLNELEKKAAVKNASRMILEDVFSRAAEIAAAARRIRAETPSEPAAEPSAAAPAAAQPAGPWWQTK